MVLANGSRAAIIFAKNQLYCWAFQRSLFQSIDTLAGLCVLSPLFTSTRAMMIPSVMFSSSGYSFVIARKGEYQCGSRIARVFCLYTAPIQTMAPSYWRTQDAMVWGVTTRSKYPHKKRKTCQRSWNTSNKPIQEKCYNTKILFRSSFKSHHSMNKSFVSLVSFKNNAAKDISILHCLQQQLLW